jgi:hypothetical protein
MTDAVQQDDGRTPTSRQLLVSMLGRLERLGEVHGTVKQLCVRVSAVETRLNDVPTRDDLNRAVDSIRPRSSVRPKSAGAIVKTILPWALGGLGTLAMALGAWLAT